MDLADRVALVTGASIGLGRRIALDLAAQGATVVGVARGADALASFEAEARERSPASWTRALDVGDTAATRTLVDEIAERHGRLDILINNAAIERRVSVLGMDEGHVRETMRVNFDGTVAATLAAMPHMVARGQGWIVNMISGVARSPIPFEAAYAASKAAVVAFSESISYELGPKGVHVMVLSPGFVAGTRMARGSIEQGMPVPPKAVHRTEEQISALVMSALGKPRFDLNATRLEAIVPVMKTLFPRAYRKGIAKMNGHPPA